jgi:glycosyltransferase involved in cell wall biosynthesis
MSEVVDEGTTGILVGNVDEAVAAVCQVIHIDRSSCRAHARQRFSAERMVSDYLDVYSEITR